mmetsp:Transcript_11497/g.14685  ORF Transcript_11497/g.14685 Transcript_11497/m.14685 type:complete len:249 (-) Transcript_11497:3659-4405(-)
MLFKERILIGFAKLHNGAHVHIIKCGQHGRCVLGFFQAARDGLAQAGHAHTLFPRSEIARSFRFSWRAGRFRCVHIGKRIGFCGAPVPACSRNAGRIYACFGRDAADRRGNRAIACRSRRCCRSRCWSGRGWCSTGACSGCNPRDDSPRGHAIAFSDKPFSDHAICSRWNFQGHLVGLDFGDCLVFGNALANLFEERCNRAFGNAFAHTRHSHVNTRPARTRSRCGSWSRGSFWRCSRGRGGRAICPA